MNKLAIFENQEFGNIRVIEENAKPYFCGSDIARALGYKDTVNALKQHCKDDGVVFHHLTDSIGRKQKAKFINEGNLYRLIVNSKLPSAEQFESWVFDEILPTIRKTGEYKTKQIKTPPLSSINMAAKNIMQIYKEAGVDPRFTALAVSEFYNEKAGLHLVPPITSEEARIYDKTEIALELGVMSRTGNPHALAIGAIIRQIPISDAEIVKVPYTNNGHSDFDTKFKATVIEKVKGWLELNNYPAPIRLEGKSFKVSYSCEVA